LENAAAVRIQAITRGRLVRRRQAEELANARTEHEDAEREAAATRVQALVRGRAARRRYDAARTEGTGLAAMQGALAGVRVGVDAAAMVDPSDASVEHTFRAALQALRAAGAAIVPVSLGFTPAEARVVHSTSVLDEAVDVADRIRAWEQLRELGLFLSTRRLDVEREVPVPADQLPARKDGEEEGEEGEEGEGGEEGEEGGARKKKVRTMRVRTVVSDLVDAFSGTLAEREALTSALDTRNAAAVDAATYLHAVTVGRMAVRNAVARALKDNALDALVYPTAYAPAAAVRGADDAGVWVRGQLAAVDSVYGRNAALAAVAGAPAITLPCGLAHLRPGTAPGNPGSERMPVGCELLAKPGSDLLLLKLAALVEPLFQQAPDPIIRRKWARGVAGRDPM
jgi:Asp-tRNA(Asn)/Glu-tRNA(Gln) amidotransferase A subunit family amidase